MKIVFLPIDNRPVCYQLPKLIADIDDDLELILPDRNLLGGLKSESDVESLLQWLLDVKNADVYILSLDTLAYGGLIPSRRSKDGVEAIRKRLNVLKDFLKTQSAKVFAFSSVMRISNNNINEEEKAYWNLYGEKIFKYSYTLDKFGTAQTDIPAEILEDYLATRQRNFEINKLYIEWQKEGIFDTLIFSKDDCAEFGLNVKEARELERLGGYIKTGADEIPLTLLARAVNSNLSIHPVFLEEDFKNLISNYEDVSVEKSLLGQLELAKIRVSEEADVDLYVNNFRTHQGEIVMKRPTELFSANWHRPEKFYAIADVRNANGADNKFVGKMFEAGLGENFLGYSGWNTTANTVGTLVCTLKVLWGAKQRNTFNLAAFKKLQTVRFLDDWAYQANVRVNGQTPPLGELMKPYEVRLECKDVKYSYPWARSFEIEIELSD